MSHGEETRGWSPPPGSATSRFTTRHLTQMSNYSLTCPLRLIGHIDLDAFYAQCEMVRLNLPLDKPLAVRQWQGLIAINYPARAFGIKRLTTVPEARKLCPDLAFQHVATWREGESTWAYRPDAAQHVASDKVSLDPYRIQSRKIMTIITETLPAPPMQKVEKASIDEVFMDLSCQVQSEMLQKFPILQETLDNAMAEEQSLPLPQGMTLDWDHDEVIPLSDQEEHHPVDWDDVALNIAAKIVRHIRATIFEKLRYTCSGGVSINKLVSKLGSGHKKPNAQTVIRSRAIPVFLGGIKFTKIRNLGGKLGEKVASEFGTESVAEILNVPLPQLCSRLGPDTGTWVYNTVRGIDTTEVTPRTAIKSMLSAKQFRPAISRPEQASSWFRIFSADIYNRLVDVGVLDNKRRPKTLTLHYRGKKGTKGRGMPIPKGKPISVEMLVECCEAVWAGLMSEGYGWPCEHLSVNVSGFEEGVTGNMGIGGFLVKRPGPLETTEADKNQEQKQEQEHETKRRKLAVAPAAGSITSFFNKAKELPQNQTPVQATAHQPEPEPECSHNHNGTSHNQASGSIDRFLSAPVQVLTETSSARIQSEGVNANALRIHGSPTSDIQKKGNAGGSPRVYGGGDGGGHEQVREPSLTDGRWQDWQKAAYDGGDGDTWDASQEETTKDILPEYNQRQRVDLFDDDSCEDTEPLFFCAKCTDLPFGSAGELQSHQDWHFAMELQEGERERGERLEAERDRERGRAAAGTAGKTGGRGKGKRGGKKVEAGQQRLRFG